MGSIINSMRRRSFRWEGLGHALRKIRFEIGAIIERIRKESPALMFSPTPADLIREISWRIMTQQVPWGKDSEIVESPDVFTVSVSREAWGAYYQGRVRRDGTLPKLTAEIVRHVSKYSTMDVRVTVRIVLDETLADGDREIVPSFSFLEDVDRPATGDATAFMNVVPEQVPEPVYRHEGEREDTRRGSIGGASERTAFIQEDLTPAPLDSMAKGPVIAKQDELAFLAFRGKEYPVESGNIVGTKQKGMAGADVVFPPCDTLQYMSRRHMQFNRLASGNWEIEQVGGNGSVIVHDGKALQLSKGDRAPINHGDLIYCAEAKRPITFRRGDVAEDATCLL